MKAKKNEMTTEQYRARIEEIATSAQNQFDNVTAYVNASLRKLSEQSGYTLKDVVTDYNKVSSFKVSYDAIKQYKYDKGQVRKAAKLNWFNRLLKSATSHLNKTERHKLGKELMSS
jgi:hypothetical protein